MKKAFSLSAGVLLYIKVKKMTYSPIIKFPTKKFCSVWMKKAISHDAGVCFIRRVGKRALFAKINNSD